MMITRSLLYDGCAECRKLVLTEEDQLLDDILEFVKVRFYFKSKRWKDLNLSKEKAKVKASFKLATAVI